MAAIEETETEEAKRRRLEDDEQAMIQQALEASLKTYFISWERILFCTACRTVSCGRGDSATRVYGP
eukprot:4786788-Karenia_brevis.AAC.1